MFEKIQVRSVFFLSSVPGCRNVSFMRTFGRDLWEQNFLACSQQTWDITEKCLEKGCQCDSSFRIFHSVLNGRDVLLHSKWLVVRAATVTGWSLMTRRTADRHATAVCLFVVSITRWPRDFLLLCRQPLERKKSFLLLNCLHPVMTSRKGLS